MNPAGEMVPLMVELTIEPGVDPFVEFPSMLMVGPVGSAKAMPIIEIAMRAKSIAAFDNARGCFLCVCMEMVLRKGAKLP